jgi:DNA-nicking Smr family endonuclease
MDFGDILAQWEAGETKRQTSASSDNSAKRQDGGAWRSKKLEPDSKETSLSESKTIEMEMEAANKLSFTEQEVWMQRYPVIDKDAQEEQFKEELNMEDSTYLRSLAPEGTIDLHGLTRDKAWIDLDRYIDECKRRGFRKILIVHGKGNHSEEEPVLLQMVRTFIEQDNRLGAHGYSDRSEGGKGSTWVIIR